MFLWDHRFTTHPVESAVRDILCTMSRSWAFLALSVLLVPPSSPPPAGVWQAEGYGTIWEFTGDTLQSWEVTTTTCVRAGRYPRAHDSSARSERGVPRRAVTAWIIRPGASARAIRGPQSGHRGGRHISQTRALPTVCTPPTPNTTEGTFAVFERTMGEQYAFFGLRGLDWPRAVDQGTSEAEPAHDVAGASTTFWKR